MVDNSSFKESVIKNITRNRPLIYDAGMDNIHKFVREEAVRGDRLKEDISLRIAKCINHLSIIEVYSIIEVIRDLMESDFNNLVEREDFNFSKDLIDSIKSKMYSFSTIMLMSEAMENRLISSWDNLPEGSIEGMSNVIK